MPLDENSFLELQKEFRAATERLQAGAQSAIDETKRLGGMQGETKAEVDKLLAKQGELAGKIDQMAAEQTDLAQRMSARRGGEGQAPKTLGELVAGHDDLKAFVAKGATGTVTLDLQAAILNLPSSGGALTEPSRDGVVSAARQKLGVKDLLSQGRVDGPLVQYAQQQATTGTAGVVADDGVTLKPQLGMTWVAAEAPVRTIAGWIPVHKHMLDDVAFLRSEIDTELRYQVDLAEERQILTGDGTGENLRGLVTEATPYNQTAREASITGFTAIDKLRLAMLQVTLAGWVVDGHVLSAIDWALMETQKDTQNRYIFGDPTQEATPRLWGRPVVDSPLMPEDKFLTGAFRLAATYYERQGVQVRASTEDRDNFVKNMVTVLAEKRAALAVKRKTALVYGDFGRVT